MAKAHDTSLRFANPQAAADLERFRCKQAGEKESGSAARCSAAVGADEMPVEMRLVDGSLIFTGTGKQRKEKARYTLVANNGWRKQTQQRDGSALSNCVQTESVARKEAGRKVKREAAERLVELLDQIVDGETRERRLVVRRGGLQDDRQVALTE
ncbi:hypothetical protein BT63DRAFT_454650 [Microthyrium microscopicum]|uniref:Uncharacterized protein n=1 Tax=Microthyrium microscopicum TaxID=703497 RepID=A0A6A6UF91_9PEZI|nr:hypothetical protein BT63DRAFT_454650 [Microthyrium microscopicum]